MRMPGGGEEEKWWWRLRRYLRRSLRHKGQGDDRKVTRILCNIYNYLQL
jgi:hypothetical protein